MRSMNDRNLLKGLLLALIALVFGVGALRYSIGHLQRAGPGLFPLLVSSILFLLGAAMVVRSRFTERAPTSFNGKNIAIIMGSLAGFAVLSAYVNMIAGIVFLVFASAFAGTSYSVRRNAIVAAVLVAVAFVFQIGLGLQLPLY
jgi:Tripartite tricarboxylate transporter TctB family